MGELPSGWGARLASVGHSPSIMTIAGPIVSNTWTTVPSGPVRRPNSTALNVVWQKPTAAATSRQTNIGIIAEELSGMGLTSLINCPFEEECSSRLTRKDQPPLVNGAVWGTPA